MKTIIKSGFEARFGDGHKHWIDYPKFAVDGIKIFNPRPWQVDCFNSFESTDKRHGIINAPTGAGKSTEMCHLSSYFLSDNYHKNIIAVPQKNIGSGFIGPIIFQTSHGDVVWRIEEQNSLCQKYNDDTKTQKLINFLKDDISSRLVDRAIICTHQTLIRAYDVLKENNQLDLINNAYLWIDEAHRIQCNDGYSNKLGGLIDYCCKNDIKQNIWLFFVTATWFRGDRQNIIPDNMTDKFHKFCLPYDRHFEENCKYLKSFRYDFILTDKGYLDAIKKIFKNGAKKTILYMPDVNSNLSGGDKIREANEIVRVIGGNPKANIEEDENGVINLTDKKGQKIRVIDLVDDESDRDKKDKYIFEHPDKIDVIVNLRKFIEGADWPQANRIVIIGTKGSLKEVIQIMGRAFRDHASKENKPVEIYHVIPYVSKKINKVKSKNGINNFMKAVYCSLLLELIINPPSPKIPSTKKGIFKGGKSKPSIGIDYFTKVTDMDESTLFTIVEDVITNLAAYRSNNLSIPKGQLEIEYDKIIKERIDKTELKEFSGEFSKMILSLFERRTKNANVIKIGVNGINVKNISANLIKEDPYLGFLIGYTSGITTVKNLKDFRKLIDRLHEKWEESYELIKNFEKKYHRYPAQQSSDKKEAILGAWCSAQRYNKKDGILSQERTGKLELLNNWKWDIDEETWMENYNAVKVRQPYYNDKNQGLWNWCCNQRKNKKDGDLPEDKIKLLEEIPWWSWDVFETKWQNQSDRLEMFIKNNRKIPSHHSKNKGERSLGDFVMSQREKYREGTLEPEKIKKLESLGAIWKWEFEDEWEAMYQLDLRYRKNPSAVTKEEVKKINAWEIKQRAIKKEGDSSKKGKYDRKRLKMLDELPGGFMWDVRTEAWAEKLDAVIKFCKTNKKEPSQHSKDKKECLLGCWLNAQRIRNRIGKLSEERKKLIEESIGGFMWDIVEERLESNINLYRNFIAKNNRVPSKHSDDPIESKLGVWIGAMRYECRSDKMSKETQKTMESVFGLQWCPNIEKNKLQKWETIYDGVHKFLKKNKRYPWGKSKSKEEAILGRWVQSQRSNYNKKHLSKDRQDTLEKLWNWTWAPKLGRRC